MIAMSDEYQLFIRLAVALAIGLLIGVERGWQERGAPEGSRVAGVRTYTLLGLLGGVSGLLAEQLGGLCLGLIFVGLAGVLTAAHVVDRRQHKDVGITSLVASLITFVLGAMAALGELAASASAAVVTTLLLGYKPLIHQWVSALERKDLSAGLTLLLISVVLLPLLPNQGYGPWQALNPYEIWWMVVLIASISFAGYYAIKLMGKRRGTLFTGLFGGLASSTALTLHFSRLARDGSDMTLMLAAGILVACGTMFPRMLLVATLINPALLQPLLWPALVMALITYSAAAWYCWSARQAAEIPAARGRPRHRRLRHDPRRRPHPARRLRRQGLAVAAADPRASADLRPGALRPGGAHRRPARSPASTRADPAGLLRQPRVPWHYERSPSWSRPRSHMDGDSFCAYCARMKRGIMYRICREQGYNVLALAQHLDDLAESLMMSMFHGGQLRTMKAHYRNDAGDVRIIRPLVYCRERQTAAYADAAGLPVVPDSCPACFSMPTRRDQMKAPAGRAGGRQPAPVRQHAAGHAAADAGRKRWASTCQSVSVATRIMQEGPPWVRACPAAPGLSTQGMLSQSLTSRWLWP
jgi:uncharacterized membrane protein YhiD involved in acid resistance